MPTDTLVPFAGSCLILYLVATTVMGAAFILDVKDPRRYSRAATTMFCSAYIGMVAASILTVVALVVYFSQGGLF